LSRISRDGRSGPETNQDGARPVSLWFFLAAAVLLSFERVCYLWIWRGPAAFRYWGARPTFAWIGEPVDVLCALFAVFKVLQCAVFIAWCLVHGDGALLPLSGGLIAIALGAALIAAGQLLNLAVFYRLGKVGVFYGNKFGHRIPWSRKFPFSCLKHPQYLGALLSIWGFFLMMRAPHDDWYVLPLLETAYYAAGAYLER
jgi:phosphatidyl-N-methylethanolamine N-methyltransferase